MNEYLLTSYAAERQRDFLAEAESNGLARQAREGRLTWWRHLAALLRQSVGGRWSTQENDVHRPVQRLAH